MADQREDVLNYIKYNGPVLPIQIAKHVNTNTLFASAILSELVARKILKITHAAIGGSPLYYLPGQEEQMDVKLSVSLHGKEKEAYNLLKDKKVLREVEMEPWQRVAVKSLTDFSIRLNVTIDNNNEFFWKHHLVSDEEAKIIIGNIMGNLFRQEEESVEIFDPKEILNQDVEENIVSNDAERKEVQTQLINDDMKKQISQEIREQILQEVKQKENLEVKKKEIKKEAKAEGVFYNKIMEFMKKQGVEVLKEEVIKKDKELDFLVNLNSGFGKLKYLVKAKNKPLVNEADVSIAFSEGQLRKMPVVLLTNGKVNKKAFLLVEQKMQGQLIIKEI